MALLRRFRLLSSAFAQSSCIEDADVVLVICLRLMSRSVRSSLGDFVPLVVVYVVVCSAPRCDFGAPDGRLVLEGIVVQGSGLFGCKMSVAVVAWLVKAWWTRVCIVATTYPTAATRQKY